MKTKDSFPFWILILGVAAILSLFIFALKSGESLDKSKIPLSQTKEIATTNTGTKEDANTKEALKALFEKAGFKEVSKIREHLEVAVATGDDIKISKAFNEAIYSPQVWKVKDAIVAIKSFLNDSSPLVRFCAGQALLTVGDPNGMQPLLDLSSSSDPIEKLGLDLRIQASLTLAKFRKTEAIDSILELYSKTRHPELSGALANLGVQLPEQKNLPFVASSLAIVQYAKNGATWWTPEISSVYQQGSRQEVKTAAAWALASLTGDEGALNYLVQTAQPAIYAKAGPSGATAKGEDVKAFSAGIQALKYLGSIKNPQAKQTLEAALDSQMAEVVRIATVNLIFNQGGSEKANAIVLKALEGEVGPIDAALLMNIAAQSSDPEIRAATKRYVERSQYVASYSLERGGWPIYNWIDDYVVKLNR